MEIIATHIGADFDAFASMVAARRLHPKAKLFFPGSKEESVRRMLEARLVEIDELRQRHVDPARLERIVLCDTRQRDRVGVIAEWLAERPDLELIVYDHHPPSEDDLEVGGGLVDPGAGSTSTLLLEEIDRRGLDLSVSEATLLLMGIYEDTGCLSYPSTGARDMRAAARLLERGADLGPVRRYAVPQLDLPHVEILHRMTRALAVHRVQGHRIGTVALELGEHVEELAPLVSRCLELFDLSLLFGIFGDGQRVTVIARGEVAGFDLGTFLAEFAEGGGHATAAAATVKGRTALEVRERLLEQVVRALPPAARAADLMIERFLAVDAAETVEEAKEKLNRRRVNAAPVLADDRVAGTVSRQSLDAAIQHGLGDRPVASVMSQEVAWVGPEAPAGELAETLLEGRARFVLVGDAQEGRALGLVTRFDVLRHLYREVEAAGEPLERQLRDKRRQERPVGELLEERLPAPLRARIERAAEISRRESIPVYLVGGLVRDLLLDRPNRDLDLVVEGDGLHFARLLAEAVGGRSREHRPFKTAVVIDPEGFRLDVATARSEFYRTPAALPEVEDSPLRQDLYRRDFTINTLAIRLGPQKRPGLVDYFGGQRDLEEGVLRVLHSLSFIDDPTRALRAVRLEQRLGFRISPETERLIRVAVRERAFEQLSGSRLREELVELLDDPVGGPPGIERLRELGVLEAIHPAFARHPVGRARLREAVAVFDWYSLAGLEDPPARLWRLMLLALTRPFPETARADLARRLALPPDDRALVERGAERVAATGERLAVGDLAPHQVSEALAELAGEEVLLLLAGADERRRGLVQRDLLEVRPLRLAVRGQDLVESGFEPGPAIGAALRETWRARVDGRIGADEELAFARRALEAAGAPRAERPTGAGGERR